MNTENSQISEPLVKVRNVTKYFPVRSGVFRRTIGYVKAVDGVDLDVFVGETLGLVGESGCGKSTLGRAMMYLDPPTSGSISYDGDEIAEMDKEGLKSLRRKIQIMFQDPFSSLNPRMPVGETISEGLIVHKIAGVKDRKGLVTQMLQKVGLHENHSIRYPHEFSGGQRQRIGIARALVTDPSFLVCDEPVSALDVSIQSQILNLLTELKEEFQLTYLFISHDLSVVEHICDRVAVMYLGKIVEIGDRKDIFENPKHPYTQALISAAPIADPRKTRDAILLEGDVPSPIEPPSGCSFHPRCPIAEDICKEVMPKLINIDGITGQRAACHMVPGVEAGTEL
ncbi:MAG: dipeptide/oligopeptide/nickel ABC transporter ATP-binding protein [Anaerolineaceae bacterium]|nr:dipeptide/oligopeptide/nickel ABC transporter ATP-binding protein [Anaerolineaceae bacterium]